MAKKIGEALRDARREAGLSIRDVERLSRLAAGTISQIENGVRADPGWSTVVRIARSIGVGLDNLAVRCEGRSTPASALRPSVAIALAEIGKVRTDSQRAVERLDRAAAALGVRRQDLPRKRR